MNRCISPHEQSLQAKKQSAPSLRSGSLLIELIVASILMASLAAIFVPGIAAVNRQRLSIRDDALMLVELNNVAEKSKWQPANNLKLSDWFVKRYPQASLEVASVAEAVTFQPAAFQPDRQNGDSDKPPQNAQSWNDGLKIQITMPSQHSGLNATRSLTVWPNRKSTEGASE